MPVLEVGDSVPLPAIEDAVSQFAADEIVISTLPPSSSHWLEQGLVDRARERCGIPVVHVVGDDVSRVSVPAPPRSSAGALAATMAQPR